MTKPNIGPPDVKAHRTLGGILLVALLTGFCVMPAWAAPRLQARQEVLELGSVTRGAVVEAEFLIANEGDETLLIRRVDPG